MYAGIPAPLMAIAMVLVPATAHTAEPVVCELYEHADYGGNSFPMAWGDKISFFSGRFWNDRISSVRIDDSGCFLEVYEHNDRTGAKGTFEGSVPYVGDEWNDRISHAECACW